MKIQNIIVNEKLSSIIDRAQVTQNCYALKNTSDILKDAKVEALIVESHLTDIYVLNQVLDKMTNLQLVSISNPKESGVFSKPQTAQQFMQDIKEQLQKRMDSLVVNLKEELNGLPSIKKDFFSFITDNKSNSFNNSKIIDKYYKVHTINKIDKQEEKVIIVDEFDYPKNDKSSKKYIEFNEVDACLYNYQRKIENKLTNEISTLATAEYKIGLQQAQNINIEFEQLLNLKISKYEHKLAELRALYPNIDISKLENITDRLIELVTKEVNNSKTIVMYKRFIGFISRNLMDGTKYQIVNKLRKEIHELKQDNLKLSIEIMRLEERLTFSKENSKTIIPFVSKTEQIKQLESFKQKLEEQKEKTTEVFVPNSKKLSIKM